MIVGARAARRLLKDHLEAHVPAKLAALALAEDVDMPEVGEWHARWVPHEHINAWPAVTVTTRSGRNIGRDDWVEGDPEHRIEWTVRTYAWVRGDGYEETADRVELLAAAIVDAQLAFPWLAEGVQILDTPMTVSLSSIEDDPDVRASIAGAYIESVVTMIETATTEPVATADTIDVGMAPIPEEP